MFKLRITLLKEFRLLVRDKIGLAFMFIMPIILVLVITSVQNSTYELVNDNKINLLICNKDSGGITLEFISSLEKTGMFRLIHNDSINNDTETGRLMQQNEFLVALAIPVNFSGMLTRKMEETTTKALKDFGIEEEPDEPREGILADSLIVFFHPVLQESYRTSILAAMQSALLLTENKLMLQSLYMSVNNKELPKDFEVKDPIGFQKKYVAPDGSSALPNATQHNVPAWTIFAIFFVVISLGGNMVKEKLSGSFVRLKVLPTNFLTGLAARQIIYLGVVMAQVSVIFSIGAWIFPMLNLPALNIPSDWFGLVFVSLITGWCAISYALCIGVYAQTQEQANGLGAVSVVILAAIGGIFVPSFAMPQSFHTIMKFSPLYWSLESYYGLFLEGRILNDIIINILPLLGCILIFQLAVLFGLKRKNLI